MSDEQKTYILDLTDGSQRRITVPADYKVTFGPLIPSAPGGRGTLALRFYEGKEKQRAIFTDVKAFRDTSIPVEEKVTRIQQKRSSRQTPEGAKDIIVEARISEWRDPDDLHEPEDDFLSLPTSDKDEI